ncbi:MAG: hypothetical protein EOP48_25815 [Sphingobacteriales bacterium]|nr:MAG: hypothetical protein EOP48_25815 [Sphingobacteriales bacterium]
MTILIYTNITTEKAIKDFVEPIFMKVILYLLSAAYPTFVISSLVLKYQNLSNVAKFEERVKYPTELELPK